MKRPAGKRGTAVVALALTWDGSRWPSRSLPPAARAFLRKKSGSHLRTGVQLGKLFADDGVKEIRVCLVPRLSGGKDILAAPFLSPDGKRLRYRPTILRRFGDVLGVVYRRGDKS